jgi:hypothetical protein
MLPLSTKGGQNGFDLAQLGLRVSRVFPEPDLALDVNLQGTPTTFFLHEEAVEVFSAGVGRLRHGCTGSVEKSR